VKRRHWIAVLLLVAAAGLVWMYGTGNTAKYGLGVWVADGFEIEVFAEAPDITAPSCIAASPTGEVFVGEDDDNVRATRSGTGRIRRFVDADGDGVPESNNIFAEGLNGVRGLLHLRDELFVVHPPFLSVLRDVDGDGIADENRVLIRGFGHDPEKLSPDHSVGGIRMGIDGWLYVHVGDQGIPGAVGTDGRALRLHGGGVVRVRPDGTGLELYAKGIRNCYDIAVSPTLDIFGRENDNDGHGWTVRLHHIVMDGEYGYPGLYRAYPGEVVPPLADYGRCAGTGALWLHEPGWPAGYGDALYTGDWARGRVYVHRLEPDGASFRITQDAFFKGRKPTDFDADGRGAFFINDWGGHSFGKSDEPHGRIYRVRVADGGALREFPDLAKASAEELIENLDSESQTLRLWSQRELIARSREIELASLAGLASEPGPLLARVAAMHTIAQLWGSDAGPWLAELVQDPDVAEHTLRALLDVGTVAHAPTFVDALASPNPRVRRLAVSALARLGSLDVVEHLIPLLVDDDAHVRQAAVRGLRRLGAVEAAIATASEDSAPERALGAIQVLAAMHDRRSIDGLESIARGTSDPSMRAAALDALARLYHREREWDDTWWGTRPDIEGPYFDPVPWEESSRVVELLDRFASRDEQLAEIVALARERHGIPETGATSEGPATVRVERRGAALPKGAGPIPVPRSGEKSVGELDYEDIVRKLSDSEGDPRRGSELFEQLACAACHAIDVDTRRNGPVLANVGDRYGREELIESVLEPSKIIALGYDTWMLTLEDDEIYLGVIVHETGAEIRLADTIDTVRIIPKSLVRERSMRDVSTMPEGLTDGLPLTAFTDLIAYLESLRSD
jgi:putative heme-binding domain-containing protein